MEKVNLMDAREGDSPEKKQGKTEYRILSGVRCQITGARIGDSPDSWEECRAWVRFYKNARAHETRSYPVADSSVAARLALEELKPFDLAEVRFSEDGKEVVEMVKLGRLRFENEKECDGSERRPGREGEVANG